MIIADQPALFGDGVVAALSSRGDGQMQLGWNEPDAEVVANRQRFLRKVGLTAESTALVRIKYADTLSYDCIKEVTAKDAGVGMLSQIDDAADCLVTTVRGLGLFLPIADCGATVVYDPVRGVLALAHLGRHSTVAHLAKKLVTYLTRQHGSVASDLRIWISPSIAAEHYVLTHVDFVEADQGWRGYCTKVEGGFSVDVQGYNRAQFIAAGVQPGSIQISSIDTATDQNYWSHHTERTVRGRPAPPRFAVVAALS